MFTPSAASGATASAAFVTVDVGDQHAPAVRQHRRRDGQADALCAAGHDGDLLVQQCAHEYDLGSPSAQVEVKFGMARPFMSSTDGSQ
jgi:hypothetical protein